MVGTWGGKLLRLKFKDLSTVKEQKIISKNNPSFGRVRGIYDTPKYLFLTLDGGELSYIVNDVGKNNYQQNFLPSLGIQMGKFLSVVAGENSTINFLGTSREVARIVCCETYSVIARDTPLPGGGRATIIREGYFQLTSKEISQFDRIFYEFGEKKGSILELFDVLNRPDIVQKKLKGEDITPLIGGLTIDLALKSPAPLVRALAVPGENQLSHEKVSIPFTIKNAGGGVGEVLILHNGKLIKSDGYYKDERYCCRC